KLFLGVDKRPVGDLGSADAAHALGGRDDVELIAGNMDARRFELLSVGAVSTHDFRGAFGRDVGPVRFSAIDEDKITHDLVSGLKAMRTPRPGDAQAFPISTGEAHGSALVDLLQAAFFELSFRRPSSTRLSAVATTASSGERGAQPRRRRAFSLVPFLYLP